MQPMEREINELAQINLISGFLTPFLSYSGLPPRLRIGFQAEEDEGSLDRLSRGMFTAAPAHSRVGGCCCRFHSPSWQQQQQ